MNGAQVNPKINSLNKSFTREWRSARRPNPSAGTRQFITRFLIFSASQNGQAFDKYGCGVADSSTVEGFIPLSTFFPSV
ncbi:unnamed protein product [Linum trigynum]|uniref:Uncharacterized protein n=1 Tax=Linum trigynum TaxID=586398 RepID=A0AAV2CTI0_9ROSI